MIPGLKVLAPGLHTTVQDLGRTGYQAIGVPVSGALDSFSLRLANALAGNPQGAATLEILVSGPTLEVAVESVRVALIGLGAGLEIRGEQPRLVPTGRSVILAQGDAFEVALGGQSACCYLAVAGGVAVPLVLGSASTYARAAIGGLDGRALRHNDVVPLATARAPARAELRIPRSPPRAGADQPIRVIMGPQQEYLTSQSVTVLLESEFRVSKDSDRMGMRLDGPPLHHRDGWDIVSDAIATGSIQVPGSGQPIVLLADHQTTGGYPKIATVISIDLPAIGRRRPGDPVRFVAVDLEEAEALCREEERRFAQLVAALEPISEVDGLDLGSLYDNNLISGVTTGRE